MFIAGAKQAITGETISLKIPRWPELLLTSDRLRNENGSPHGPRGVVTDDKYWRFRRRLPGPREFGQDKSRVLPDSRRRVAVKESQPLPVATRHVRVKRFVNVVLENLKCRWRGHASVISRGLQCLRWIIHWMEPLSSWRNLC